MSKPNLTQALPRSTTAWKKPLRAGAARAWTLEARLMFDAAAVADAAQQVLDHADGSDHAVLDLLRAPVPLAVQAEAARSAMAATATATASADAAASPAADHAADPSSEASADRPTVVAHDPAAAGRHEILFVDGSIPDLDVLLAHVRSDVQVVVLDAARDPWAQMSAVIEGQQGIEAIHLVTHGQAGDLIIGGQHYSAASLQAHAAELQAWQGHLAAGADLLLYGCDVGAGEGGHSLLSTLAELTHADVAASTNDTGSATYGGDWTLEVSVPAQPGGTVDHAIAFDRAVAADYRYELTSGLFSSTTGTNVDTAGVTTGLIGAGKLITFDPINVTTTDATAKLIIRAYDVDYGLKNSSGTPYAVGDPASEWDGVYIQKSGDATWTFVGYLNGTNNNWSYTTLDISSVIAAKGAGSYIVRVVPDDNGTQTQANNAGRWVVGTSIAEVVLGSGGAVISTLAESSQTVTATLTPTVSGNFTVQYLLVDATGRAAAQVNAAANGLTAGTAFTQTATLVANSNFYSSWSALPSGSYTLQATLYDATGVVQDTKSIAYDLVQTSSGTSTAKVFLNDLATWYGSTPADLAHQATSDTAAQQLTLKGSLASTSTSSSATIAIQELVNGSWTTVKLKDSSGSQQSSITIGKVKNWQVNLYNDQSVGTHTYRAVYKSGSSWGGKSTTSYYSASFTLTVDTPSATTPAITDLTAASWTGSSAADLASQGNHALTPHTTADSTPALTGTAGKLASLNVYDNGVLLGYTTADASGKWTFQVPDYQLRGNGSHSFTVKDIGNSNTSSAYALTIDSTAPTQTVSITSLSADTGSSSTDFVTATAGQTISATLSSSLLAGQQLMGSLDGGATWTDITASVSGTSVAWAGQTLRSGYADASQYVPWAIQMKVVDAASLSSALASQDYQLLTGGGTPVISTVASSAAASVTTNFSYPIITGTGDADTVVDVYATIGGSTSLLGTVAVDRGGNWSLSPSSALANGSYTLKAVERNTLSGYTSPDSATKLLTINTSLPLLTLNSASDSGVYTSDGVTNDDTPSVRVSFPAIGVTLTTSDTVKVFDAAGTQVGQATLTSSNISSKYVDITTSALGADAGKALTAVITHGASTYTSNELDFTLDRTAPVLGNLRVDGDSISITITESGTLSPVAPDLSTFTVKVNGSTVTPDSLSYDPVGKTITLTLPNAVGVNDSVTVAYANGGNGVNNLSDLAGNTPVTMAAAAALNLTDLSAPTLASIALQSPSSGPSHADSVTFRVTFADASGGVAGVDVSDFVATLGGSAANVASVSSVSALVYDVTVDGLAGSNGTLVLGLATQAQGMDIVDVSANGNALADVATTGQITLDHNAPAAPTLALHTDTGSDTSDDRTSDPRVDVSGLEPSASWEWSEDGGSSWTTGSGSSFTLSTDGAKRLVVRQTDTAGNAGASSGVLAMRLDRSAPTPGSAHCDGSQITLAWTEVDQLDATATAGASAWTVKVDGQTVGVSGVSVDAANGQVVLTLASSVMQGQLVTVDYTDPTAGDDASALQDRVGNDAASFTNHAVVNDSTQVAAGNHAPVAADTTVTTDEYAAVSGTLPAATDADGDSLSYAKASDPAHGSVVVNLDGSYIYTPDYDYSGADSFTYTVNDGHGGSSTYTVAVTVVMVNHAPEGSDVSTSTDEDTAKSDTLPYAYDERGDSFSYSVASGPAHGQLDLRADGRYTYTPDADFHGTDSFTYTVTDVPGLSNTYTVSITVNPVNDLPVGADASISTDEDTAKSGTLPTATDVDGDSLTYAKASDPTHGSVTINANGSYTYTPTANYHGSDSFTYTVSDGHGGSKTYTVAVTVNAVNDAPVGAGISISTDEDTAKSGSLPTATDADGDSLAYAKASDPTNGTVTVNADGSYTYTPTANYHGSDSFTYSVSDGHGGSNTYTVAVTVIAVNDAPVGAGSSISTDEDTAKSGTLPVATDADGDSLTYAKASDPTNGAVTVNTDGSYTYTPSANYHGSDSFTFTVRDGHGGSNTYTVNVTVNAVNDAPVAAGSSISTDEDTAKSGSLPTATDTDGDSLTYAAGTAPTHGAVTINADGTYTYSPTANYHGSDSFTYTVSDGHGGSNTYAVNITVHPVNDSPVATDDQLAATEGASSTYTAAQLLGNDSDVDGNALTIASVTSGSGGTAVLNADGTVTFTPNANVNGTADFSYTVSDGSLTSNIATVTVNVAAVNDAPVAAADTLSATEDTPVTYTAADLLGNDSDVDGNALHIASVASGSGGTAVLNADGTVTFTPNTNFNGTADFSYTVSDGQATSNTATVTVNVAPINEAPVASNDALSATEDTPVTYTAAQLLGNDSDVDGNALHIASVTSGTGGTAVLNADGTVTFTPSANFNGTADFSYTVSDGQVTSNVATVTISVAAVNDAPVGAATSISTDEDTATGGTLPAATDADGDSLTYAKASDPGHGRVEVHADGTYTYTPAANFHGTDSFRYTVSDGHGGSNTCTVTVTVNAVNDAPTWSAVAPGTVAQDGAIDGVLPVAADLDGDVLAYGLAAPAGHGTATVWSDGRWTYRPAPGWHGVDRFEVSVDDGHGGRVVQTVEVTVLATPSIGLPAAFDNGDSASDRVTSVPVIGLAGEAEPGGTLRVYGPQGELLGTVQADASGHWSLEDLDLSRMQGDAAGAQAGAAGAYSFGVRLQLPGGGEGAAALMSVQRVLPPAVVMPVVEAPAVEPGAQASTTPGSEGSGTAHAREGGAGDALRPPAVADTRTEVPANAPAPRGAVEGDIYTRPSGFQVMVAPSTEPALKLFRGVEDQVLPMNRVLVVQVPADAFVHTVITETITLRATQADGTPLPPWLSFDGLSGKFVGTPPVGQAQDLAIRVSARDSAGREVSTMFRVHLSQDPAAEPAKAAGSGPLSQRAGFSRQLARGEALVLKPAADGRSAWQQQGRQLGAALPVKGGVLRRG